MGYHGWQLGHGRPATVDRALDSIPGWRIRPMGGTPRHTIHAHQDLADDLRAGIKKLAVLSRNFARPLLWNLFCGISALL